MPSLRAVHMLCPYIAGIHERGHKVAIAGARVGLKHAPGARPRHGETSGLSPIIRLFPYILPSVLRPNESMARAETQHGSGARWGYGTRGILPQRGTMPRSNPAWLGLDAAG